MRLHRRVLEGMNNIGLLATMVLGACSGAGDSGQTQASPGIVEERIIAGVDARSTSLNAVGSLVEVYRYTIGSCGVGGSSGFGGKSGIASTVSPPITSDDLIERHGHLDRLRALPDVPANAALASGTGGMPSNVGGGRSTPIGGSKSVGGMSSVGGVSSVGGSSSSCTTTEVVRYYPFCTGTLVGPTAVQTAKHCIMDFDYYSDQVEFAFAVGPDASNP